MENWVPEPEFTIPSIDEDAEQSNLLRCTVDDSEAACKSKTAGPDDWCEGTSMDSMGHAVRGLGDDIEYIIPPFDEDDTRDTPMDPSPVEVEPANDESCKDAIQDGPQSEGESKEGNQLPHHFGKHHSTESPSNSRASKKDVMKGLRRKREGCDKAQNEAELRVRPKGTSMNGKRRISNKVKKSKVKQPEEQPSSIEKQGIQRGLRQRREKTTKGRRNSDPAGNDAAPKGSIRPSVRDKYGLDRPQSIGDGNELVGGEVSESEDEHWTDDSQSRNEEAGLQLSSDVEWESSGSEGYYEVFTNRSVPEENNTPVSDGEDDLEVPASSERTAELEAFATDSHNSGQHEAGTTTTKCHKLCPFLQRWQHRRKTLLRH